MRQGDRRGSEVDLYDFTYDGNQENGFLSGGLGQLTDGEYGQDNFRLDPRGRGMKVRLSQLTDSEYGQDNFRLDPRGRGMKVGQSFCLSAS